ncbi:MAG: TIGR03617 family F420-dependent LLM class oxidoreductase [Armatimonadota bacterium]|nr:TIGR03617 family F420-dependent LLM class oxidoreductase [Armatimonadota bacterium]MDR5703187.1 TIGR03617 family F420-dependent LLM class oxidoreductase [Armatimonadota bacterium]MDR7434761.1 TIGR03617 family F420-dependent LLM class oxidoreductase [Armatimonadota bacterium]
MKVDAHLATKDLRSIPEMAKAAESCGFDGLLTSETAHDPFLPLALAAEHTSRIQLGTAIAVAFARSPVVVAHTAWDLAALSGGRFLLGLGTQVKAHIERRFSMPWGPPVPRLREYVQALRAVWRTWQEEVPLNFRGRFYTHTLMTPFFSPSPLAHPRIPVFIAGVNTGLCRLAGELCDGFFVHPLHTPRYLHHVVLPAIGSGLARAGRSRAEIEIAVSCFVATGRPGAEREEAINSVKRQIAFYASTPSYRIVLEVHGWQEIGERLQQMARYGQWREMGTLVTDEMLEAFAVVGPEEEIPSLLRARYDGLADRISWYREFSPEDAPRWRKAVEILKGIA